MDIALEQMIFYHAMFSAIYPLLFGINLGILFLSRSYGRLNFRIYLVMPAIFLSLAISFFSGITLMFFTLDFWSYRIILMLILLIIILIAEIYHNKRLKFARTSADLMKKYVRFCKLLYILLIAFWAIVFFSLS